MQHTVALAGRVLLSLVFLVAGIGKIVRFADTRDVMVGEYLIPMAGFFLAVDILLEIGGGLSLLTGFKTRWGVVALIVSLIPATLVFHGGFADQDQLLHFLKNGAILGGLLMVFALGPGSLSLDARHP